MSQEALVLGLSITVWPPDIDLNPLIPDDLRITEETHRTLQSKNCKAESDPIAIEKCGSTGGEVNVSATNKRP